MHGIIGTLVRLGISIGLLSMAAVFGQFHALAPQAAASEQVAESLPALAPPRGGLVLADQPVNLTELSPASLAGAASPAVTSGAARLDGAEDALPLCPVQQAQAGLAGVSAWTLAPDGAAEALAQ